MATELVASFEIDGLHHWPEAPSCFSEFRQPHRHLFKFVCFVPTTDPVHGFERSIELWELREGLILRVHGIFGQPGMQLGVIDFGALSCEGIASKFKEDVFLSKVFVGEEYWLGALVS